MGNLLSRRSLSRRELLKALVVTGLALGSAAFATGCGSQQAPAAQPKTEESTKPDVDKARQEGVVQLYTSLDTQILAGIIDPFKAKYGIDVKVYRAGSREVVSKILSEWDAGKYICDVLDASDVATFLMMKKRGMLTKYLPASTDAYPADMKDKDGYFTYNRLTQVIIGYNTKLITGDMIPKGWGDLADTKYKDKIVMQEPNTFTQRIYTVVANLPEGWAWLEKVGKNKPKFVQSVQVMEQMNETSEVPIAIFQNDNIVNRATSALCQYVWLEVKGVDGQEAEHHFANVYLSVTKPIADSLD